MFGHGPDGVLGVFAALTYGIVGFLVFLVWLAIILLLVRFLLIGTRAAKHYLRSNGQYDGVLPQPKPAAPAAPAAPATTTRAPRTPKAP
jgi:hypothetical protein